MCVRIYLSIYSQRHITLYINRFASEASLQAIIALFIVSHAYHTYVRVYTNPSTLNIVSHFWLIDLHQRRHIEASHLSSARHTCPICVRAHTYPSTLMCVRIYVSIYSSTSYRSISVTARHHGSLWRASYVPHLYRQIYPSIYSQYLITLFAQELSREASCRRSYISLACHTYPIYVCVYTYPSALNI